MAFGVIQAPSTFLRLLDQAIRKFDIARCYLDDLIIFFCLVERHVEHIKLSFGIKCVSSFQSASKLNTHWHYSAIKSIMLDSEQNLI